MNNSINTVASFLTLIFHSIYLGSPTFLGFWYGIDFCIDIHNCIVEAVEAEAGSYGSGVERS